ncbi:MAG: hypothetical protein M3040_05555 [Bacteroidota bacterium]|nr:hypothetical protein [Bacteroidota bacterium]
MKHLLVAAVIATATLLSCEKEKVEAPENLCPVVAASAVPQTVKDSFLARYPAASVTTWFNKDNTGYCASFTVSGVEKLSQFANNGIFIKEQIENNESNEDADAADGGTTVAGKVSTGCKCEINDGKD